MNSRVTHRWPDPCAAVALPPDLGRWEKTGLAIHGSATMRSRALAARVEGTVNSSRECAMAFIKRRRIAVSFVLPYALTWGRPRGTASSRRASCWLRRSW